jgi:hypothetical protein
VQASFSKVLEGGSPAHIRAALEILRSQLQCAWRVIAALRHLGHLSRTGVKIQQHDVSFPADGSETGTDAVCKNTSCREQVEGAAAVVAVVLKKKLPDAVVLHRVLLAFLSVLSGEAFKASRPEFPCVGQEHKQRNGTSSHTDGGEEQHEAEGVCMNIDGMRLQLEEEAEEEDSSDEQTAHVLNVEEAEALSLLVLQVCCTKLLSIRIFNSPVVEFM